MISPIKKLYYKIKFSIENKNLEKDYISEYETQSIKHIWGISHWDDISENDDCNLITNNDIDLLYHKDTNDYSISIETIYKFNSEEEEKNYLKVILNSFTNWMIENNYDTNDKLKLNSFFNKDIDTHFKTIEECYANFKLLVNGYCNT